MQIKSGVRRIARRLGYDIIHYNVCDSPHRRRQRLIEENGVDLVADVGANIGQYGNAIRDAGYKGRIVSFEPIPEAFAKLQRRAHQDRAWECQQIAVGNTDGITSLNVSRNSVSSSILPALDDLIRVEPQASFVNSLKVPIRRLDTVLGEIVTQNVSILIKMDVQGYEHAVLDGAVEMLRRTRLLELELSLVPLYEGQHLYRQTIDKLDELGFGLVSLEPIFIDREIGRFLQMDGLFEFKE